MEEVIFKSCPTPLGKKQRAFPTDQMKPADRIERIVNDLFEFGVPIEVLFDVDDLLKAKNIPKVSISCMIESSKMHIDSTIDLGLTVFNDGTQLTLDLWSTRGQ